MYDAACIVLYIRFFRNDTIFNYFMIDSILPKKYGNCHMISNVIHCHNFIQVIYCHM